MVGLHAAQRDECVRALGERVSKFVFEFANFVAAETERDGVVALDDEPRAAAERGAQPVHRFDGRRPRQQRHARRVEDGGRACGTGRRRHRSAGADARSRMRGASRVAVP